MLSVIGAANVVQRRMEQEATELGNALLLYGMDQRESGTQALTGGLADILGGRVNYVSRVFPVPRLLQELEGPKKVGVSKHHV